MAVINVGRQTSPLEGILGIMGGLGQGAQAVKQERDAQQLQALGLLAKNPGVEIVPADPGEAQMSPLMERITGGPTYRSSGGAPVVSLGGIPITLRQRPDIFAGAGAPAPTTTSPVMAPAAPPGMTPSGEVIPPSSPLYAGAPITQGPLHPAGVGMPERMGAPASESPQPGMRPNVPRPLPVPGTPEMAQYDTSRERYIAQHPQVMDAMRVYSRFRDERSAQQVVDAKLKVGQLFDTLWEKSYEQQRGTQNDTQAIRGEYWKVASNMPMGPERSRILTALSDPNATREQILAMTPFIPGAEQLKQDFEMRKLGMTQGFQRNERLGGEQFQEGQQGRQFWQQTSERLGGQDFQEGQQQRKFTEERMKQLPKVRMALRGLEEQHGIVEQDIGRALDLANRNFTTGFLGGPASKIQGTPAYNLARTLDTIRANIGFDKLSSMREASPTGGALGQVSDFENRMLQSVFGSLDQAQSNQQIVDNLIRLQKVMQDNKQARTEAFQADFGDLLGGGKPQSRQQSQGAKSGQAPAGPGMVIPKTKAEELLGKLPAGVSRKQAIANWQKQGITIGQ